MKLRDEGGDRRLVDVCHHAGHVTGARAAPPNSAYRGRAVGGRCWAAGRGSYRNPVSLHLSQIAEADALLTNDPLALLIGMMLDQQVSERTSSTGRWLPA